MRLIGGDFHVEVHGITADVQVLGRAMKGRRGDIVFQIDIPDSASAFTFSYSQGGGEGESKDPREYAPTTALVGPWGQLVELRLLRIKINAWHDLNAEGFNIKDPNASAAYDAAWESMQNEALQIAADLCEWLRLDIGQHWIEPRGTYPRVVGMSELVDLEAGRSFGVLQGHGSPVDVVDSKNVVFFGTLAALEKRLASGTPHADELLMSESLALLESAPPSSAERSTLLAAIAIELRTKRELRRLAEPDRVEMVQLVLDNPREVSMAAHGLFGKSIPVFAGRHLGEEHALLARRLQRLFERRNKIAHRGESVTREQATEHVEAAHAAFAFLDGLSAPHGAETDGGR